MLSRLRNDVQLAVLTLFGACAVLGVTPFAVYRFASGKLFAGVLDAGIVACIAGSVVYAWRSGQVQRSARFVMVTSLIGCTGIATLVGVTGLFWMYPTLLASHLLVGRREAVVASALSVAFLMVQGGAFESTFQQLAFLASATIVGVFSYLFAHREETQRRQLELLAQRDPLTGASNRRVLAGALEEAVAGCRDHGRPCGLLVLDLDHFKQVNDLHGHEAGDAVLVAFAALVRETLAEGEGFFRTGGEEFLLLLPGLGAAALADRAECLRDTMARRLRCGSRAVTVSAGAAILQRGETAHAWLARADMALYRAKREGRNRCVLDATADVEVELPEAAPSP